MSELPKDTEAEIHTMTDATTNVPLPPAYEEN